jgi:hypothetical protein
MHTQYCFSYIVISEDREYDDGFLAPYAPTYHFRICTTDGGRKLEDCEGIRESGTGQEDASKSREGRLVATG